MIEPKILWVEEKALAGIRISTSLVENRDGEIWRPLRSRVTEFYERVGTDFYSVKVYDPEYHFSNLDPAAKFDKWAAIAVSKNSKLPEGFESLSIPAGQYAEFIHRGTPEMAQRTFGYIFGTWLPRSAFDLDDRPHFEILGNDWSPFDESAQEAVLVPIKPRKK